MGIESVAVFSEADANALHVRTAERAVPIGPSAARESYLNIPRIIEAATAGGADAIHPGYGFLSENPAFAEACADVGITFVGPPAEAMRIMGSKAAAKALMERSAVPVLPGYYGERQTAQFLAGEAQRIGFPVAIKAVAGGGGRGMRVVNEAAQFASALEAARQEAIAAFGNDRVLIERFLQRPRHIEVQIFADSRGNVLHLFERDCSSQRRHQKVIEEAPAPGMDPHRRAAMGEAAVTAARAGGYVGAGTVEFIADADGFFFLEMNTRLQVEHPVTEMITGFDLVEWQLRIAAGEPLPVTQHDVTLSGHAFEARIYAEDPVRDFAPSTGRLVQFRLPEAGAAVRVDTGFVTGDTVPVHYDPMLAKLIVHAQTRDAALGLLQQSLAMCEVVGVATNLDLLHRIATHPAFAVGGIDTDFIARHAETLLAGQGTPPYDVLAAAALGVLAGEADAAAALAAPSADPFSPWYGCDHWWLNSAPERMLEFHAARAVFPVRIRREADVWRLTTGERSTRASGLRDQDGRLRITLDGVVRHALVTRDGETISVRWNGETFRFQLPDPVAQAETEDVTGGRLVAPLPGQVTEIRTQAGERVTRGEVLVVLEAMKTVFRLAAPADGVVERLSCTVGETVQEGQVLVGFVDPDEHN